MLDDAKQLTIKETQDHIDSVRIYLEKVSKSIEIRARDHDKTKLENPELPVFIEFTPKLKHSTYGSDVYKSFLKAMKPALDHHYAHSRHHPEHFTYGIHEMNLIDLIEMLCDWIAASKRHKDGDVRKSIEINQERFGYSDELKAILLNTINTLISD